MSMTPHRTRRPRCCRTCFKPMQGHPTGKNNPCRPAPNYHIQSSPSKPWPRTNQVIGRMMDSFHSAGLGADTDADNELDDFDASYECPSPLSSSSDESATSTSTLVNPNKRRPAPCTPPRPSKRAATSVPRSRRSLSSNIGITLVPPPAPHSGDRSFFLDSPFHHAPYHAYTPDPIQPDPSFVIPDTGDWSRMNPKHKHPTNNAQLAETSPLQRAGSERPTEFVPSPARVPARKVRRTGLSPTTAARDAPEVQMLQAPPLHPSRFWGTECPTERAGSESRVPTPAPAPAPIPAPVSAPLFTGALSSTQPKVSPSEASRMDYPEKVSPKVFPRAGSVPLEEQEQEQAPAPRSVHGNYDVGDKDVPLTTPATPHSPTSNPHPVPPARAPLPLERTFENGFALASKEIFDALLQEILGSLTTWARVKMAASFFIPLFLIFFAADLAADWAKENWLS